VQQHVRAVVALKARKKIRDGSGYIQEVRARA
jgi:hypothetical protein